MTPGMDGKSHWFETVPKAELHVHLEGCLEPAMALDFAKRNRVSYPYQTIDEIRDAYQFRNLSDFVGIMQNNSVTLQTERDFYELAYSYMQRASQDNVVHVEMAMSPQGGMKRGIALPGIIEPVIAAFEDARHRLGMTGGIVLACLRHHEPSEALAMLQQLKPYREKILALGLHGPECGFPPAPFERHFNVAREYGWHTTAHAGEEGPPEYIWQALDVLKVERIDHGVTCDKDQKLVDRLAEERIPLTVCPLSNVYLGVFAQLSDHNLLDLHKRGLNISVHTDDPAYFDGHINHHLDALYTSIEMSDEELRMIIENGISSRFTSFS